MTDVEAIRIIGAIMVAANPLSSLPSDSFHSFPGQQEGERVLYMIRPHWSREVFGYLKGLLVACCLVAVLWYLSYAQLVTLSDEQLLQGWVLLLLIAAIYMLYVRQFCEQSRTYITDRRFVRFEGAFPGWQSQRSIFWNDVVKARTSSPNFLLRLLKVGSIEVLPNYASEGQSVLVRFVALYGDLGSYIEKIIFTFRSSREEMQNIREFVAKPKGQRY